MRRKLAVFILYSLLLLASGYFVGRSAATPAALHEIWNASRPLPVDAKPAGNEPASTTELTDWPDLTP